LVLGYRFGLELKIPILQQKNAVRSCKRKADRFVLMQQFREQ